MKTFNNFTKSFRIVYDIPVDRFLFIYSRILITRIFKVETERRNTFILYSCHTYSKYHKTPLEINARL